MSLALAKKLYCTGAFLDVSQVFDRVRHANLLFKLNHILPGHYYLILKSYLEDRFFSERVGCAISPPAKTNAGVPQGAVIAPLFSILFISDQPSSNQTLAVDFVVDKDIIVSSKYSNLASLCDKNHLHLLQNKLYCHYLGV